MAAYAALCERIWRRVRPHSWRRRFGRAADLPGLGARAPRRLL